MDKTHYTPYFAQQFAIQPARYDERDDAGKKTILRERIFLNLQRKILESPQANQNQAILSRQEAFDTIRQISDAINHDIRHPPLTAFDAKLNGVTQNALSQAIRADKALMSDIDTLYRYKWDGNVAIIGTYADLCKEDHNEQKYLLEQRLQSFINHTFLPTTVLTVADQKSGMRERFILQINEHLYESASFAKKHNPQDVRDKVIHLPCPVAHDETPSANAKAALKLYLRKEKGHDNVNRYVYGLGRRSDPRLAQLDITINGKTALIRDGGANKKRFMAPRFSTDFSENCKTVDITNTMPPKALKSEVNKVEAIADRIRSGELYGEYGKGIIVDNYTDIREKEDKSSSNGDKALHAYSQAHYADKGALYHYQERLTLADMKTGLEQLLYLHGVGVFHNDIKPANLLIQSGKGICLADLGNADLLHEGKPERQMTESERQAEVARVYRVGTPIYMPPGCLRKKFGTRVESDLYGYCLSMLVADQNLVALLDSLEEGGMKRDSTDKAAQRAGIADHFCRHADTLRTKFSSRIDGMYASDSAERRFLQTCLAICHSAWKDEPMPPVNMMLLLSKHADIDSALTTRAIQTVCDPAFESDNDHSC
jgi:hypothetical protein